MLKVFEACLSLQNPSISLSTNIHLARIPDYLARLLLLSRLMVTLRHSMDIAYTNSNPTGKTLFSHSAGNVSPDSNESVTVDTVFWYGSLAKVMTTIAALQCIEQGLTTLDAPVGDLVPELGNAEVLEGFDEDGKPILKKPQTQITLRLVPQFSTTDPS
jgi:hypothetical protein